MAASLIGGLLAAGHPAGRLRVAEPMAETAARLRARFNVETGTDNAAAVAAADVVVLAVKPQQMNSAVRGLPLKPAATVISIAAGVRIESLGAMFGAGRTDLAIVRAMPNTPALYGAGISGVYAPPGTPPRARGHAELVLGAAGPTCWVAREELLDAVTALSGSGPAYFFLLVEALREAGTALGLDADTANRLALHTFTGSARMAEAAGTDVAALRVQVTSKGGTTEAALAQLESAGLRRIFAEALGAAAARSRVLGDELHRQTLAKE